MTQELINTPISDNNSELGTVLPFPFNQQSFCRYEPIHQRVEQARVLVVDDLLRDEEDLSPVAIREWAKQSKAN